MKANATFKMAKETKRLLANITDAHERGEKKRMMIDAQLQSMIRPKKERRNNNGDTE
jgi:hypothetical protein